MFPPSNQRAKYFCWTEPAWGSQTSAFFVCFLALCVRKKHLVSINSVFSKSLFDHSSRAVNYVVKRTPISNWQAFSVVITKKHEKWRKVFEQTDWLNAGGENTQEQIFQNILSLRSLQNRIKTLIRQTHKVLFARKRSQMFYRNFSI